MKNIFVISKNTVYLQRNVEDDGSTKRIHILRILCQRPRSLRQIYLKSASDPSPACGFLFFYNLPQAIQLLIKMQYGHPSMSFERKICGERQCVTQPMPP